MNQYQLGHHEDMALQLPLLNIHAERKLTEFIIKKRY